jgi:uncharacterized Zn finger protein
MANPIESGMPRISKEEKVVPCPSCGKTAKQTTFIIGKAALPTINCMHCGYTEDRWSVHVNNSQN